MVLTSSDDISFLLSGGANNTDPDKSIGGEPSNTPLIPDTLNNLFDDVLPEETEAGFTDYRAFYIANDGETQVFNLKLWIEEEVEGGSNISMGIEDSDELQIVSMTAPAGLTGGSVTYSIQDQEFTVNAVPTDLNQWSQNFQLALLSLEVDGQPLFTIDTTVSTVFIPSITTSIFVHNIVFGGDDGSKNQGQIELVDNNLIPATVVVLPATSSNGSPINTIAPELNVDTSTPGGVVFFVPTANNPIALPKLNSGDSFPLWVRRDTAANVDPLANDGFTMRFSVDTF